MSFLASGRENSLVQTFCESCVHFDIIHSSIHMTGRLVIQGCPTLRGILILYIIHNLNFQVQNSNKRVLGRTNVRRSVQLLYTFRIEQHFQKTPWPHGFHLLILHTKLHLLDIDSQKHACCNK